MDLFNQLNEMLKNWQENIILYLPKLALGIIILVLFYFLAKIFRKWSYKFYLRIFKSQPQTPYLISLGFYAFFMTSGLFLGLEALQLDGFLTKLLAGAGIIGIVAGFAFKDIVSNAFAGMLIKSQRPFKEGDWVKIQDIYGMVVNMGITSTCLRNGEGQKIYIPNQLIYNTIFTNYSHYKRRMVKMKTGVSYGDDLERVKEVTLDEVKRFDVLLPHNPIDFYFTEIASSSYNFEVRFWIKFTEHRQYLEAMSNCIMQIKKRFEQENISIAYTVMTLDFGVKGGINLYDNPIEIKSQMQK